MKNKMIGIFICTLLISSIILPVAGATSEIDVKTVITNENGLIDNIYPVHLYGTSWLEIITSVYLTLMTKQENVVSYINYDLTNRNDVSITVDEHLIITTNDGNTLFDDTYIEKIPAYSDTGGTTFFNRDVLEEHNYLTGFFKATLEVYIQEDGSHKTLAFNGFFFNYGSIVFNPNGKVIT